MLYLEGEESVFFCISDAEANGKGNQNTKSNADLGQSTSWSLDLDWCCFSDILGTEYRETANRESINESAYAESMEVIHEC